MVDYEPDGLDVFVSRHMIAIITICVLVLIAIVDMNPYWLIGIAVVGVLSFIMSKIKRRSSVYVDNTNNEKDGQEQSPRKSTVFVDLNSITPMV